MRYPSNSTSALLKDAMLGAPSTLLNKASASKQPVKKHQVNKEIQQV
jgi:hypothetical protein